MKEAGKGKRGKGKEKGREREKEKEATLVAKISIPSGWRARLVVAPALKPKMQASNPFRPRLFPLLSAARKLVC